MHSTCTSWSAFGRKSICTLYMVILQQFILAWQGAKIYKNEKENIIFIKEGPSWVTHTMFCTMHGRRNSWFDTAIKIVCNATSLFFYWLQLHSHCTMTTLFSETIKCLRSQQHISEEKPFYSSNLWELFS